MPLPRKPCPKRRVGGSRSSRRRIHENTWLHAKLEAIFVAQAEQLADRRKRTYRGAYGVIIYLNEGDPVPPGYQKVEFDENGQETPPHVKEKAPDLAAEGFALCFRDKETLSG